MRRSRGDEWPGEVCFALHGLKGGLETWAGNLSDCAFGAGIAKLRISIFHLPRHAVQPRCFFLEDWPGAVGGAVVDHDDFVRDTAEVQLEMQVLDGGRDAAFLVTRGDDDGQKPERGIFNRR